MSSWGDWRQQDWQERLIDQTRQLFEDTARRHGLTLQWDQSSPAEIACTYPEQPGLDFSLWLSLQNDEMVFGGQGWRLEVFPADRSDTWDVLVRALDGLITGQARVVLYTPLLRENPYWTIVQLNDGRRWRNISTGAGCALPPIYRKVILQNGRGPKPVTVGLPGVAWGCLASLAVLILLLQWLFD